MTEESTFQPLGETDRELHGTSALIVCGFAATEQDELVDLTRVLGLRTVPIIFIVRGDGSKTLRELALLPDLTGQGGEIPVPRAVIMSGLTEKELHLLMNGYRATDLARPFWATVTPTSETWTIKALLSELVEERKAMSEAQASKDAAPPAEPTG